MVRLSVNVNKVATIRNSRGAAVPSVVEAARVCVEAGAPGITVHPRADERHIRPSDVRDLSGFLKDWPEVEFNVEGDPRPELMALVHEVKPHQCTLVPVLEGEVTSQGGWPADTDLGALRETIAWLREVDVRVSVFIDATPAAVDWAKALNPDRVELFTEPYAQAFHRGHEAAQASFEVFARAAEHAHSLGLGVNAGHDLDLENLGLFKTLPHLEEVSIGHALISQALFDGLDAVVRAYLESVSA